MGFSVSASTALIFAALFLALGIFYPAMANSYERVQAADADQADRALEQADSNIRIESTASGEVDVTNNGSTALPVDRPICCLTASTNHGARSRLMWVATRPPTSGCRVKR